MNIHGGLLAVARQISCWGQALPALGVSNRSHGYDMGIGEAAGMACKPGIDHG